MRLMTDTESWRDAAIRMLGERADTMDDCEIDEWADELRDETLCRLTLAEHECKSAVRQSVGGGVIIQSATKPERAAFAAAFDAAKTELMQTD